MRRGLLFIRIVSVALVLLFAAQSASAAQETKELTIIGKLTPTVEAGGWLVVAEYGKYLLTNANQFRRQSWFREGATVEATGHVRDDVMSIHMEGVPFQARTMRPRNSSQSGGAQNVSQNTGGQVVAGTGARSLSRVVVTGESSVQAQPDTVVVTLAVVTQNASASEAQAENASKTDAVVRAVRTAAGTGAEVKTSGYSLQPQYAYKEGAPPLITSYIVRNAVTVTTGDLNRAGSIIDAGSRAGANSIDGLSFMLRNDGQARERALSAATREALSKARSVATTLGGSFVRVVEVQEAAAFRPPIPLDREAGNFAVTRQSVPTPVEPGSLEIRVQVQLVAEVEVRQ